MVAIYKFSILHSFSIFFFGDIIILWKLSLGVLFSWDHQYLPHHYRKSACLEIGMIFSWFHVVTAYIFCFRYSLWASNCLHPGLSTAMVSMLHSTNSAEAKYSVCCILVSRPCHFRRTSLETNMSITLRPLPLLILVMCEPSAYLSNLYYFCSLLWHSIRTALPTNSIGLSWAFRSFSVNTRARPLPTLHLMLLESRWVCFEN